MTKPRQTTGNVSSDGSRIFKPSDLPVPIYLNQRIVLDLLATIEDGFSHFTNVQTSTSAGAASDQAAKAGLGVSNVFALLGVSIEGSRSKQSSQSRQRNETTERVHTPVSLFARLRSLLQEGGVVLDLGPDSGVDSVMPGTFVEFPASLAVNPIIDALDGFIQIMDFAKMFEDQPQSAPGKKRASSPNDQIRNQITSLRKKVETGDSIDIVATVSAPAALRAVLGADKNFFSGALLADVDDGEYRVLGKVSRVLKDEADSISLLRKTSLGSFTGSVTDQLLEAFKSIDSTNIRMPKMEFEIHGPVLQIVPIAIFA